MIRCETIGLVSAGFALGGGLAYPASRLIGSCPFTASLRSDPLTLLHVATGLLLLVLASARRIGISR